MKRLIIIVLSMVLFAGCGNLNSLDQNPISKTVIQDGFELTITSAKGEYSLKRLFTTEPLDIVATLTYIGKETKTEINYTSQIGDINLYHESGTLDLVTDLTLESFKSTIKKGESLTVYRDFTNSYYQDNMIVGNYIAEAYVFFSLNEDTTEWVTLSVEIPITINK